jgi:hypothetical protein
MDSVEVRSCVTGRKRFEQQEVLCGSRTGPACGHSRQIGTELKRKFLYRQSGWWEAERSFLSPSCGEGPRRLANRRPGMTAH